MTRLSQNLIYVVIQEVTFLFMPREAPKNDYSETKQVLNVQQTKKEEQILNTNEAIMTNRMLKVQ